MCIFYYNAGINGGNSHPNSQQPVNRYTKGSRPQMADVLDGVPKHVLGWPIKTKTQITLTWIIPTVLELFVYIVLITSDISVCVQHFIEQNYVWASLTLAFIWLPAVLCFCTIITSPWQWPDYYVDNNNDCDCNRDPDGCSTPCVQFVFRLIFNFVCFPVGAISRYCIYTHINLYAAMTNTPFCGW